MRPPPPKRYSNTAAMRLRSSGLRAIRPNIWVSPNPSRENWMTPFTAGSDASSNVRGLRRVVMVSSYRWECRVTSRDSGVPDQRLSGRCPAVHCARGPCIGGPRPPETNGSVGSPLLDHGSVHLAHLIGAETLTSAPPIRWRAIEFLHLNP